MKGKYLIRSAHQEDISKIIDLCAAHAKYEQTQYDSHGKAVQ